jgi:streptomycin 6-kinase
VSEWGIAVEEAAQTPNSLVAFGRQRERAVFLKVTRRSSGEWRSGRVLQAFRGRGVVDALEQTDGAVLLERLVPGTALSDACVSDEEATAIIAELIGQMAPASPAAQVPSAEQWGQSFERHAANPPPCIPKPLHDAAHRTDRALCASQAAVRLLHGDLHHHNVLLDSRRGWVAIDPKGVIAEPAFEVGAALRNPSGRAELFTNPVVVRSRVDTFARRLRLEPSRVLGWAFAQAVLAALWDWEDGGVLDAGRAWLALASVIQSGRAGEWGWPA